MCTCVQVNANAAGLDEVLRSSLGLLSDTVEEGLVTIEAESGSGSAGDVAAEMDSESARALEVCLGVGVGGGVFRV